MLRLFAFLTVACMTWLGIVAAFMNRQRRYRYMSDDFFADCNRCSKPLRESHSHIMVVNVDGGRQYFHAACQAPSPEPELGEGRLTAAS